MPMIECLGRVGIFVRDVSVMLHFYSEVLGLDVTDIDEKAGLYFLSAGAEEEHHELLLCASRTASEEGRLLQQISFKCPSLSDVIEFHRRLVDAGANIDYTIMYGNAIAVYFYDPEGNRAEVYWDTGLKARQGYILEIDLYDEPETIKQKVVEHVKRYAEDAWSYVAGVAVGQDISDRKMQLAGPMPQFSLGKSHPGFGPTGPYLVTPDELENKDDVSIGCTLGGETVQAARTSIMIFSVPKFIEEFSAVCALSPGDIIFSGTPAGVGLGRNPPRYRRAGETLVSTIGGVGTLTTNLV